MPPANLPAGKCQTRCSRACSGSTCPTTQASSPGLVSDWIPRCSRAGNALIAAKSDPITFATDQIGWYAVHVNANDIACSGADPRWFLATVLLPAGATTEATVETIFRQISDACRDVGASLVGGHTEVTHGLSRPLVAGHMLGEVDPTRAMTTRDAQPGDALILTRPIAIEGTAIIARELPERLAGVDADVVRRAAHLLVDPGISVLADARLLRDETGVHALHDPTEGGLAQALHELSAACGAGVEVDRSKIPVLPECRRICAALGIDPMNLIASGTLLAAVDARHATALIQTCRRAGVRAEVIGHVTNPGAPVSEVLADGTVTPLTASSRDALAALFE